MDFLKLVKLRHSVRKYDSRKIEPEKLEYIMECVRMAPSAVNFQPWKFKIIQEEELLQKIKTAYPREWIETVPCIIVACANHNESWHRRTDNKDHGDIDVAIATEHLCLAAAEQGLGTCWVCNFDPESCKQILNLPSGTEPIVMIPIGYPQEETIADKKRKEINDILF